MHLSNYRSLLSGLICWGKSGKQAEAKGSVCVLPNFMHSQIDHLMKFFSIFGKR